MVVLVLNAAKLFAAQAHFICEYRMKESVMVAITDQQKARMLDLTRAAWELVYTGKRSAAAVLEILQIIKNEPDFVRELLRILEPLGNVTIPAMSEPFVVRKKFVAYSREDAPIATFSLSGSLNEWFVLNVENPPTGATELCYARLNRTVADDVILAILGNKAVTTFAAIYALVERQKNGEGGVLLTDGSANIFYACDVNGETHAVSVGYALGQWFAEASFTTDPRKRSDGARVFFSN